MRLQRRDVQRLSAKELERLHANKQWGILWEQALPLVSFALKKLLLKTNIRSEPFIDDMMQEANLAARQFVENWDPAKGRFSTWIVANCMRRGLDTFKREANGPVGGRDAKGHAAPIDEQITPDTTDREGLENPAESTDRADLVQKLRSAVGTLERRERLLLQLLNCNYTLPEAAESMGVSANTARRTYAAAVSRLAQLLSCSL